MEQIIQQIITWAILVVGLGGNYSFIKKRMDKLDEKVGSVERKQDEATERYHKCREELHRVYAEKPDVDELFNRMRAAEGNLSYMKGKANGAEKTIATPN